MEHSAWVAIVVGSSMGGFIPVLWGGGLFASLFFSAAGALIAVWINFKMRY